MDAAVAGEAVAEGTEVYVSRARGSSVDPGGARGWIGDGRLWRSNAGFWPHSILAT